MKSYIQHLPFTEQVSLAAWLSQLIETEVKDKVQKRSMQDEQTSIPEPPEWTWNTTEKLYTEFKESGEKGLSWKEGKAKRKKESLPNAHNGLFPLSCYSICGYYSNSFFCA